jgi:WW domain-containing oxidoreductase
MARGPDALDLVRGLDWSDKTVLITGASSGIGFETARAIAATGAEVFMACRTPSSAEQARASILDSHPKARLALLALDLGDLDSVESCARAFPRPHLDRLICNAGVYGGPFTTTAQGLERTVGVCHFGHLLLFDRLRPKLLASPAPRLVMVSSESHRTPRKLDFSRFPMTASNYRELVAYGQAKLCNALMAAEVHRRWGSEGLGACALHPGALIATSIGRNSSLARLMVKLSAPFAKTVQQGAATTVHCATSPSVEGGGYYSDCAAKRASEDARSARVSAQLWQVSEAILADLGFALTA